MKKLIAILNVIAWAGFWAFGYIALTADVENTGQMVTALILAAIGGGIGMLAYFRLIRISEETGYARGSNQLDPQERERAQAQWGK